MPRSVPMDERCPCKLCGGNTAVPRYDLEDTVVFACARCDFHFIRYLDPPPASADGEEGLADEARSYIEERLPSADLLLPARLALVQKYRTLPGARCLDVGAGVGQFLLRLNSEGAVAQGIEPSRLRRRFARDKYGLHLDGEPVESRHWRERFAADFDLVTLWDVIEHVNSPMETVGSIGDLLRPGGLLFIDTPSRLAPPYRLSELAYRLSRGRISLFLRNFYAPVPFGHKQIFTPGQLVGMLEGSGFEVLSVAGSYAEDCRRPIFTPAAKIVLVGRRRG